MLGDDVLEGETCTLSVHMQLQAVKAAVLEFIPATLHYCTCHQIHPAAGPHLGLGAHVQFAEVPWGNEDEALASSRVPAQPLLSFGGGEDEGWVLEQNQPPAW